MMVLLPPAAVTFQFDPTSYTVSESDGAATLTFVKNVVTTATTSVEFSTEDDSAQGRLSITGP